MTNEIINNLFVTTTLNLQINIGTYKDTDIRQEYTYYSYLVFITLKFKHN